MAQPETKTLEVPTALLTYDVRRNDDSKAPPVMLIGSPMGAAGFETLAGHFDDRTVITYDPRGSERSRRTDDATETTPEEHADDIHRVISDVAEGPVDVFASSGGAVNALALIAHHPEDVRILVAHEPVLGELLPDREQALAVSKDIHDTYLRNGFGPAMAKFIALASYEGELPDDYLNQPPPDPAMFGLPTEDDGTRDDPLLGQNMVPSTHYLPDFDAVRAASTRIVIAAGDDSKETITHRSAVAAAERIGIPAVMFPGDHGGFLGGEYGQMGEPDAFAAKLREVLDT